MSQWTRCSRPIRGSNRRNCASGKRSSFRRPPRSLAMKTQAIIKGSTVRIPAFALMVACLGFAGNSALAQDNVTVSKSRLEELERKEKELDRLKGDFNKTQDENVQLKKEQEKMVSRPVLPAPA